jgi:hypothetical protein
MKDAQRWSANAGGFAAEFLGKLDLSAERIREKSEAAYPESLTQARIDVLAFIMVILQVRQGIPGVVRTDLAARITLVCAFLHGISHTETTISEGQYVKAAAALKQDMEILMRLEATAKGEAAPKENPHPKYLPESGRLYGKLNDVAHPSNVDLLEALMIRRAVSEEAAGTSPFPRFVESNAIELYEVHVWCLLRLAQHLMTLMADLYGSELDLEYLERIWSQLADGLERNGHIRRIEGTVAPPDRR